jgi:hypothetical protein
MHALTTTESESDSENINSDDDIEDSMEGEDAFFIAESESKDINSDDDVEDGFLANGNDYNFLADRTGTGLDTPDLGKGSSETFRRSIICSWENSLNYQERHGRRSRPPGRSGPPWRPCIDRT